MVYCMLIRSSHVRRQAWVPVRARNPSGSFYQQCCPRYSPDFAWGWPSFFVIVISDFIGAEHGLGLLINDGRNFFLVPQMLGAINAMRCCGLPNSDAYVDSDDEGISIATGE